MNGGDQDGLKSFYGYKETFKKSTTWVDIPDQLTFVHTNNPYEDEGADATSQLAHLHPQHAFDEGQMSQYVIGTISQVSYPAYATHGLEALSAVASQDQYSYAPPATMGHQRTNSHHSQSSNTMYPQHTTPSQNLDFILNPASNLSPAESNNIDPRLHPQTPTDPPHISPIHVRTQSFASAGGQASLPSKGLQSRAAIDDPELAFLLRDARNHALAWMDLFDLDLFFAAKVPVLAVECPLLLFSCASLSAKSLARVNGRRPVMDGQISVSRQSKMEFWPGPPMEPESWMRKGRVCYDIAVSLLRQSLNGASRPPTSSLPEDATPATLLTVQGAPLPTTDSDELVAATAILCVYEFLDASGREWSRHLDGAKTLFDFAKDQAIPLTLPPSPVSIAVNQGFAANSGSDGRAPVRRLSQGRRAVFWNFARQDMLSAFINNTSTRLDTADLQMWRSAGLKLTPNGYVCPSNPQAADHVADQAMGYDMISNALVWVTMKLINFIAACDEVPDNISPLDIGVRQRELLDYWESLDEQLRVWYDGLPGDFTPTAVRDSDSEWEAEKWFPRPMCDSSMQWYNFARMQLLHNKPLLNPARPTAHGVLGAATTAGLPLASRKASNAAILQQSRAHAKEIVAISNGRADEGTRIHSVQPLWTAGLVLGNDDRPGDNGEVGREADAWRRTIVGLLRGIERDVGWASEYRIANLLELWGGLPPDWPGAVLEEP